MLIAFIMAQPLNGQERIQKDSIIKKLIELRKEIGLMRSTSPGIRSSTKECISMINNTLLRLSESNNSYPIHYLNSLERDLLFCKDIKSMDSSEQYKMISVLCSDIKLKFISVQNALGSTLFSDLVTVKVVTRKESGVIRNLRVRYASLGYKVNYSRPEGNFQQLTSPASEPMVPGLYKIWVTVDGDFKVLREWSGEIDPKKNNIIEFFIN